MLGISLGFLLGFSIGATGAMMLCAYKEDMSYIKGWGDGWRWGWDRGQEELNRDET